MFRDGTGDGARIAEVPLPGYTDMDVGLGGHVYQIVGNSGTELSAISGDCAAIRKDSQASKRCPMRASTGAIR